jgi:hypothetical protein
MMGFPGMPGPTGPAGANGTNGTGGGSEKNAVACEKGMQVPTCTLASGFQETGTWSVHINAPTGAFQQQYVSSISFPVRLKKPAGVTTITYRPEAVSETPTPPCMGTIEEPVAAPGNMCVYRGELKGGLETQDKNAAFFGFDSPKGENAILAKRPGFTGELILFRSVNNSPSFKEEVGEEPGVITEGSYMESGGSWAVQEK